MSIPIQCIPSDRGPPLPKSGGTPIMGPHRNKCDSTSLASKWIRHLRARERRDREMLEAADTQCSDDMGHVHVWDSAISSGLGSFASSVHHNISPGQAGPESTSTSSSPLLTPPKPSTTGLQSVQLSDESCNSKMMRQPETRPISQDQLVAEVKGIYAGLVMVETKCIEVNNTLSAPNTEANNKLHNEQWQALIALHRTLLHEHHDFFLASQHPSASPALRRLASKYAMPARMWRHGIHSFLELLRHRLPSSIEHMLSFIYLAYSMMALLYETVSAFEDTWIECLGDLGRYRMAIEGDDIRDREVWTGVSKRWYKAPGTSPNTGRLYHHLAILTRPNALQQLYYYTKTLTVPTPFISARENIMSLFDPVLSNNPTRLSPIDSEFVRAHGILFSGKSIECMEQVSSIYTFINNLDERISKTSKKWLEAGYETKLLFPRLGSEQARRPLPEDFAIRGRLYSEDYITTDWLDLDAGGDLGFDPLVLEPYSLPPLTTPTGLSQPKNSFGCLIPTGALLSPRPYILSPTISP
ncbi:hypothetical protein NXS19_011459 [Fusarium pseudograminearum]|nr:hypothetical protein NXS19_011459 [Fusarium pseudograminearum]